MEKIAILIPCYNEEITIEKVVNDFKKELPEASIYVYDNNSTDKTIELAKNAGAIIRKESLQGKGNVIRRMFREIDAECYLMVDGDDTYSAKSARDMVNMVMNEDVDMVVGDRLSSTYFTENKRPFHNFGNSLMRFCINLLFKSDIKDIMTGYRAFSYNFVKTFPVMSKGFEIETEMSIFAIDKRMKIKNIIIDYSDRPEGSYSKLNTFSDGFKVIFTMLKMLRNYRPMFFFNIVSIVLFVLSTFFVIPVLKTYFALGTVERFPTLFVCCFTYLASLLSFFVGLILNSIKHKEDEDFEYKLTNLKK